MVFASISVILEQLALTHYLDMYLFVCLFVLRLVSGEEHFHSGKCGFSLIYLSFALLDLSL